MWLKIEAVLNTMFPPRCAECNQVDAIFCQRCWQLIDWITPPICQQCGSLVSQDHVVCNRCYRQTPDLSPIRAAVWFGKPVRRAVHQLKYSRKRTVATPLAKIMMDRWHVWCIDINIDMIIPIPLHPERELERGFNQSHLLATSFADSTHIPLETEAVFRTRATRKQPGLNWKERQANVAGAFVANTKRVKGQRILLIDDVVTTGSTLSATAAALYAAGAQSVSAYCLARAYPKPILQNPQIAS